MFYDGDGFMGVEMGGDKTAVSSWLRYHCPFSTALQVHSQVFLIHSHNAEPKDTDGHAQAQFMSLA